MQMAAVLTNNKSLRFSLLSLFVLRSLFLVLLIFIFNQLIGSGTKSNLLILGSCAGVALANYAFLKQLKTLGLSLILLAFWIFVQSFTWIINFVQLNQKVLQTYSYSLHFELFSLVLILACFSTWLILKYKHALSFETGLVTLAIVYFFSAHRNYHLDSPQIINSLAWRIGFSPQTTLIVIAGSSLLALLIYLYLFSARRISFNQGSLEQSKIYTSKLSRLAGNLGLLLIVLLITVVGNIVHSSYDLKKGLTSNGVGDSSKEGTSPLGFHSALGTSNQPAALVRLEGDYSQNPHAPMLYMRESALSEFNGNEFVLANQAYDTDITRSSPSQAFKGKEDSELTNRIPVVQSIYLLAEQNNAFGIDYPISIRQLVNPNPDKFKASFRTYSMAPAYSENQLINSEVGDPRWDKTTRDHYLVTHPDYRYKELALKLTAMATTPYEKIQSIVNYLNKNSIYTLSPNHQVNPNEDPVAPFLFGDMRGYCVHFAHATTYMLRALGIPARAATGYLTDLSQSKDGHILLRMSDRHSWAEAYITKLGWVPFDTQPEQVESHADSKVDMNLLEELMSKIDPGEEILAKDLLKDEKNIFAEEEFNLPKLSDLLKFFSLIFILLILIKAYERFSWILPANKTKKLARSYSSIYAQLRDLGFERRIGETRLEYVARLRNEIQIKNLELVALVNLWRYSNKDIEQNKIILARQNDQKTLAKFKIWKRIISFLNPLHIFSGQKW